MPSAPLRTCTAPGCHVLVAKGRCEEHQQQRNVAQRGRTDPRYNTARWQRARDRFKHAHPFCARCPRLTDVVDHIVPVRVAPDRFFDETNWQPLCYSCNRVKAEEDRHRYPGWGASTC